MIENVSGESSVSLDGLYLGQWSGVRIDDVVDVVTLFSGKIDESKPIGRGDKPQIMFSDIAHKEKLTCKEFGVHLRGLDGEQQAESTYGFSV